MAKCPNCGSDITSLHMTRTVRADIDMSYNVSILPNNTDLDVTHMGERDSEPDIKDTLSESYYCPVCNEEIPNCESTDEAHEFLKGGE